MSKNRYFKDNHEIVNRLCGMIEPTGDDDIDEIRLDNLEDTIFVTEQLITDILCVIKYKSESTYFNSLIGHRAQRFKDELLSKLIDDIS